MPGKTILMLLTNSYDPDPRVRQEALTLNHFGCRVRVLAWDRELKAAAKENMEGVEVERVFVRSLHGRGATQVFFYAWLYLKMLWRGMRISFDVVHCHDLDTLPLGFILGKLNRKPIVYDAHESFTDMLSGSIPAVLQRYLIRLEDFLIRRVDLLITVGEKLRRHFAGRGARHTAVVGNWKRLEEFSRTVHQNQEVRRQLGIPDGALAVLCITQLLKDRKIGELLAAAADCPNVFLVIGGKGALEELVAKAAASNPRTRFVGFVSGRQIADYTCATDVVYYGFDPENSNARFSAPNKLFEALAAGRPLITGDFGEIGEVVRQAQCGIVLPRYDVAEIQAALRELENPEIRQTMAHNAQQCGLRSMNWQQGEQVLYREYSALLPGVLRHPDGNWSEAKAGAGVGAGV
jgi:glycosyltransferase involved in cell wall biosynthesis